MSRLQPAAVGGGSLGGRSRRRVVALGGGHGLSASLQALRRVTDSLTAVVGVADDGGSSGRLRVRVRRPAARRPAHGARGPVRRRLVGAHLGAGDPAPLRRRAASWPVTRSATCSSPRCGSRPATRSSGLDWVAALLEAHGRVLPCSTVPLTIVAEVLGHDPRSAGRDQRRARPGRGRHHARHGHRHGPRPARATRLPGGHRRDARGRRHRARSRLLVHVGDPAPGDPRPGPRDDREPGQAHRRAQPEPADGRDDRLRRRTPISTSCSTTCRTCGSTRSSPTAVTSRIVRRSTGSCADLGAELFLTEVARTGPHPPGMHDPQRLAVAFDTVLA